MLALPLAFLYGLLRPRLTASSRRLAAELAEQRRPEEVQAVLQRALRDPSLELGLPISASEYVGVHGQPLEPPEPGSDRAVTKIGDEIIVHDAALAHQPELDDAIDAARLALERACRCARSRRRRVARSRCSTRFRTTCTGRPRTARCSRRVKGTGAEGKFAAGMVGRRIDEVVPPRLRSSSWTAFGARSKQVSPEIEYTVEDTEGLQHLEERIVRSGGDEAVGIVRDVTERKRQERQLEALVAEQAALSRVAVAVATPSGGGKRSSTSSPRRLHACSAQRGRGPCDTRPTRTRSPSWVSGTAGRPELEFGPRLTGDGAIAQVLRTGRPARWGYTLAEDDHRPPGTDRRREMVAAPILVTGRMWGGDDVDDLPRLVPPRRRGAPGEVHQPRRRRTGELRGA